MTHPFSAFQANMTSYAPQNAYALSEAARLAYETDHAKLISMAKSWGFGRVTPLSAKETQCFVASNSDMLIVAFRGTEPTNLKDWLTDARIKYSPGPFNSKVHHGFKKALQDIWPALLQELATQQTNGQSLWMTGHSLGGALATLCTAYLRHQGFSANDPKDKPVFGTYTFGCPRVGNGDFAQKLNQDSGSRMFRFVNNNDIVTRVAPRVLNYSHVGKFLYFNADGSKLEIDPGYWYRFLEKVKGVFDDFGDLGPDAFKDHFMDVYVNRTRQFLTVNPFKS